MSAVTEQTILVVDDEEAIAEAVRARLESEGFRVIAAADGREAIEAHAEHHPDLVVLDLMLPGMDGLEVCRKLRELLRQATPVLMLTARDDVSDRIRGLDAGADDYLPKPFDLDELLARLRALVRRTSYDAREVVTVGELVVDASARRVSRGEVEVELSTREFDILWLLASRVGTVVSRYTILDEVWDGETDVRSNVIDVHLGAIRAKVDKPFGTSTITTVRGAGYRLEASAAP